MTDDYAVKKYRTYKSPSKVSLKKYQPRGGKTSVNVAECQLCGDIVFSRTRHDYRSCSCGNTSVDGGLDYMRVAWQRVRPELFTLLIVQTKHQLYDDWNTSADKLGLITYKNASMYGLYKSAHTEGKVGKALHRLEKANDEKEKAAAPKTRRRKAST